MPFIELVTNPQLEPCINELYGLKIPLKMA
jgi:hypothetical protein